MKDEALEREVCPGGPRDGGRLCFEIRDAMETPNCYMALCYIAGFLHQHSVPTAGGCREFDYAARTVLVPGRLNSPVLRILHYYRYPTLSIDYYEGGAPKWIKFLCHRFQCWWQNGKSEGEQKGDAFIAHHTCNNHRCISHLHMEWQTASNNNMLPRTLSETRSLNASKQERSPGRSGRFAKKPRVDADAVSSGSVSAADPGVGS